MSRPLRQDKFIFDKGFESTLGTILASFGKFSFFYLNGQILTNKIPTKWSHWPRFEAQF